LNERSQFRSGLIIRRDLLEGFADLRCFLRWAILQLEYAAKSVDVTLFVVVFIVAYLFQPMPVQ
jgi:hypothetical protein